MLVIRSAKWSQLGNGGLLIKVSNWSYYWHLSFHQTWTQCYKMRPLSYLCIHVCPRAHNLHGVVIRYEAASGISAGGCIVSNDISDVFRLHTRESGSTNDMWLLKWLLQILKYWPARSLPDIQQDNTRPIKSNEGWANGEREKNKEHMSGHTCCKSQQSWQQLLEETAARTHKTFKRKTLLCDIFALQRQAFFFIPSSTHLNFSNPLSLRAKNTPPASVFLYWWEIQAGISVTAGPLVSDARGQHKEDVLMQQLFQKGDFHNVVRTHSSLNEGVL